MLWWWVVAMLVIDSHSQRITYLPVPHRVTLYEGGTIHVAIYNTNYTITPNRPVQSRSRELRQSEEKGNNNKIIIIEVEVEAGVETSPPYFNVATKLASTSPLTNPSAALVPALGGNTLTFAAVPDAPTPSTNPPHATFITPSTAISSPITAFA